jgi:hypothetical protein
MLQYFRGLWHFVPCYGAVKLFVLTHTSMSRSGLALSSGLSLDFKRRTEQLSFTFWQYELQDDQV